MSPTCLSLSRSFLLALAFLAAVGSLVLVDGVRLATGTPQLEIPLGAEVSGICTEWEVRLEAEVAGTLVEALLRSLIWGCHVALLSSAGLVGPKPGLVISSGILT